MKEKVLWNAKGPCEWSKSKCKDCDLFCCYQKGHSGIHLCIQHAPQVVETVETIERLDTPEDED